MPRDVVACRVDSSAIEVEDAVEERRNAFGDQHGCANAADDIGTKRAPLSRMRGGRKPRRCALARLETVAFGAFDGARELHSGRDVDLAKNVAQVCLYCLLTEEQFGGDLGIRLPVDD